MSFHSKQTFFLQTDKVSEADFEDDVSEQLERTTKWESRDLLGTRALVSTVDCLENFLVDKIRLLVNGRQSFG